MAETKSATSTVVDEKQADAAHTSMQNTSRTSTPTNSNPEAERRGAEAEKYADVERGENFDITEDADVNGPEGDPADPNIVDWDPDDPEKAMNWPWKKVLGNIAIISVVTFLTPLASSMVAPGVPLILKEFKSKNETIGAFIVSIYILGYATGPLLLAPLSEMYGRLYLYHANNVLFIIWTIACALAPNVGALLVFRFFAGIAGSCPLTIGGGSIADMIRQEKRGGAMAIFALGPLLGPVIGPVAGGYLAEAEGWRWVFWVIAIAGGIAACFSFVLMRETYPPVLLARKVARLRKEQNNPNLRSILESDKTPAAYFKQSIFRPTKMLFRSPIVFALSMYMAVVYGYLYLLFTTITLVFERRYGFSQGNVGLTYLGIGVGALVGLIIFGFVSDKIVKQMSAKGEMKPEYRLPPLIPGSFIIPVGLFLYGWSAEKHTHWIVPIIGTLFVGFGLLATFMPIQTYLVDAFTIHAASAIAASTVLRSLAGTFLPLAGPKLYAALGLGWGNSLLGFIAVALAPLSWIFFKYGERIRKSPRFQVKF
jgi:multidrug resistance protein